MVNRFLRVLDTYGNTRKSLELWKVTRCMFAEFIEAKCGTFNFKDNSRYAPDLWLSPVIAQDFTGLILIDNHGRELWLSGCQAGYGGTGPDGTWHVMESEQFPRVHLEVTQNYGQFHIKKDLGEPLHMADKRK